MSTPERRPSSARRRGAKNAGSLLWVTSPLATLDLENDTTLRLMEASRALGLDTAWASCDSIRWDGRHVVLDVVSTSEVLASERGRAHTLVGRTVSPRDFDLVVYRADPPFDLGYLQRLQLLRAAVHGAARPHVINPIAALLGGVSKIEACLCSGGGAPKTIITSAWDALSSFGAQRGQALLKPLQNGSGRGIKITRWGTPLQRATSKEILQRATRGFRCPVLLQEIVPGDTEQRWWFVDGQLLGWGRRSTPGLQSRRRPKLLPCSLSKSQSRVAAALEKHLQAKQIRIAAVDVVANSVIDLNFASPGLLREMEWAMGLDLATPTVQRIAGIL